MLSTAQEAREMLSLIIRPCIEPALTFSNPDILVRTSLDFISRYPPIDSPHSILPNLPMNRYGKSLQLPLWYSGYPIQQGRKRMAMFNQKHRGNKT